MSRLFASIAKAPTTQAGAVARLKKAFGGEIPEGVRWMVVVTENGSYVPCVLASSFKDPGEVVALVHHGICVTN